MKPLSALSQSRWIKHLSAQSRRNLAIPQLTPASYNPTAIGFCATNATSGVESHKHRQQKPGVVARIRILNSTRAAFHRRWQTQPSTTMSPSPNTHKDRFESDTKKRVELQLEIGPRTNRRRAALPMIPNALFHSQIWQSDGAWEERPSRSM